MAAFVDHLLGFEVSTVLSTISESVWSESHLTSSGYKCFNGRLRSFDFVPLECTRTSALLAWPSLPLSIVSTLVNLQNPLHRFSSCTDISPTKIYSLSSLLAPL